MSPEGQAARTTRDEPGTVRHLYVHLPFGAHRRAHSDFVTLVGRHGDHGRYVDALLRELELERALLADQLETVFIGGGTPTFTEPAALSRLLAQLPVAAEVTIEADAETLTAELAQVLRSAGVTRVSLDVQSFRPHLLQVLERGARGDAVRDAVYALRGASFDNINLDLLYGVPGQSAADLERDLEEALALQPEHLSCYELEAKPGTRFANTHEDELARQSEALDGYFERVVDELSSAGYRWYETASFCRAADQAGGRDLRSRHNLAYWLGRDYLGLGIGAVSTVAGRRWRNVRGLSRYADALETGEQPPREIEPIDAGVAGRERLLFGLRLDEPLHLEAVGEALDHDALARLAALGLVRVDGERVSLTRRGRFLGDGVSAELIAF